MRVPQRRWFTNIDHGRRHEPLQLMTMADNIKFTKHKEVRGVGYQRYDNFDAIEVPFTDAIPSDYDGVMGVPITFLDKYNPDQFEIVGTQTTWATTRRRRRTALERASSSTASYEVEHRRHRLLHPRRVLRARTYFDVGYP